jgi:hypothetical protein
MKLNYVVRVLSCALALTAVSPAMAQQPNVMLSMNVFPTNLANPNGGGSWEIVAKTDSTQGISAINAYLHNVNTIGLDVENDLASIENGGEPYNGVFGGAVNLLYGQDISSGPLVAGVGTLLMSDGPDPLGQTAWDDATHIFSGTYSSIVPSFATNVGPANNQTDANTFAQVVVGVAAIDANTTTVVRVAVPEPATFGLALCAVAGAHALRRRRA